MPALRHDPIPDRDPDPDDLAWLAFRYAANELDATAEAAFEHRLDIDQAAREALAEAVALVALMVAVPRARSRRLVPVGLAGLAAAAVLAALLAVPWSFRAARPHAPAAPAESVALAWSGLHDGDDAIPSRSDLIAWLDEAPEALPADPGSDDDVPPPWLIEAARLRDAGTPDGGGS